VIELYDDSNGENEMTLTNILRPAIQGFLLLTGIGVPVYAQTAPPPPGVGTCTNAPSAITNLLVEYPRSLTDLQTTLPAGNLPAFVTNGLAAGMAIHDKITYDSTTNEFTNIIFLVPPNLPIPTPDTYDIADNTFLYIHVSIDKVYLSCTPYAAALFVGVIRDGVPLLGNPAGASYVFSFGYNLFASDPSKVFRDIGSDSGGLGVQYKNFGYGFIETWYWPGDAPTSSVRTSHKDGFKISSPDFTGMRQHRAEFSQH
jgi:hypothetical protein